MHICLGTWWAFRVIAGSLGILVRMNAPQLASVVGGSERSWKVRIVKTPPEKHTTRLRVSGVAARAG